MGRMFHSPFKLVNELGVGPIGCIRLTPYGPAKCHQPRLSRTCAVLAKYAIHSPEGDQTAPSHSRSGDLSGLGIHHENLRTDGSSPGIPTSALKTMRRPSGDQLMALLLFCDGGSPSVNLRVVRSRMRKTRGPSGVTRATQASFAPSGDIETAPRDSSSPGYSVHLWSVVE